MAKVTMDVWFNVYGFDDQNPESARWIGFTEKEVADSVRDNPEIIARVHRTMTFEVGEGISE